MSTLPLTGRPHDARAEDATPTIWAVGDLQGCHEALERLLAHPEIAADPSARFWFVGDLVNRGPASLATLRRVVALGDRAVTVLGNHDLHLLAIVAGAHHPRPDDTLSDILDAPDRDDLVDWLRQRPLAHQAYDHLMVHAGVVPQWTTQRTLELARTVEMVLAGDDWKTFLKRLWGNEPARWSDDLTGIARMRVVVNALTRIRFCAADGTMDFSAKEGLDRAPAGYMPWFDVPDRNTADTTLVTGHWSALGLVLRPNLIALDTGCIWGGQLTAVRLHDRHVVQVDCGCMAGTRIPGN